MHTGISISGTETSIPPCEKDWTVLEALFTKTLNAKINSEMKRVAFDCLENIYSDGRAGVTLRNCTVSNADTGLAL